MRNVELHIMAIYVKWSAQRKRHKSASCMRYSQILEECKSVTLSNRDLVLPAGGTDGSGKAALSPCDRKRESACGHTTDERQHT